MSTSAVCSGYQFCGIMEQFPEEVGTSNKSRIEICMDDASHWKGQNAESGSAYMLLPKEGTRSPYISHDPDDVPGLARSIFPEPPQMTEIIFFGHHIAT
ncbi:hypothetical protein [Rhizobium sp. ZPR3]|uniref:Uncharacterized protein n=2 Tax=unclassified Rhizobium TaxID=2613769 RepID=A0AAU7SHN3_9HYPH